MSAPGGDRFHRGPAGVGRGFEGFFSRKIPYPEKTIHALRSNRGITLLDTVFAVALMLVIFVGIAATFELAVDVVSNNKARAGAIALADQRMEYMRSLAYTSVGTIGGIPSGIVPQSETVVLNGVTYTRRTVVEYIDDPKDGTAPTDTIPEDYKAVKVDVAWTAHNITRHITLVSRFEPLAGLESACATCGTLTINVLNSASLPLSGASVSVVNNSISPAVNISTYTNASGTASFIGAASSTGYAVVVTEPGYSTAQTYATSTQNVNPSPGNLTVLSGQTKSANFAIDLLGTKTIYTWTEILSGSWIDPLIDTSHMATSTNITAGSGSAQLSGSPGSYPSYGEFQSAAIGPASLVSWGTFTTSASTPTGTGLLFRFYDASGTNLIPDSQLAGNAAGFTTSTVNLSGVSTSTYPTIRVDATFSSNNPAKTPSIGPYSVGYTYGPQSLPNIAFTLQGTKTIGTNSSNSPIYKYSQSLNSSTYGVVVLPNFEFDTYTISDNGASTGYDIASACEPQSEYTTGATTQFNFAAGTQTTSNIYFVAHSTNSLLLAVRSAASGGLIAGATAVLSNTGFAATSTTDSCGQAFFSSLTSSTNYTLKISATGYTTKTQTGVSVSGTSALSVSL